jgi:hypothetical protein
MPSGLFIGLVLLSSMLFAYVVLTTFYGANKAYIAISWVLLNMHPNNLDVHARAGFPTFIR